MVADVLTKRGQPPQALADLGNSVAGFFFEVVVFDAGLLGGQEGGFDVYYSGA